MTKSDGNGWKKQRPDGAGAPREKGPAKKLVQFSSGLSQPFIQRPVMTMLLTASIIVFGILTFKQLAVNDLPAVDYPGHFGERLIIRARIRRRWRTQSPRRSRSNSPRFPG